MFKKILIGVIVLALIGGAAYAFLGRESDVTPAPAPAPAPTPEKPAPQEEPAEKPVVEGPAENTKAIAVPEFIENALKGKYQPGETVTVVGIVKSSGLEIDPVRVPGYKLHLGPRVNGSIIEARGGTSLKKWQGKIKYEDEVVIQGTYAGIEKKKVFSNIVLEECLILKVKKK